MGYHEHVRLVSLRSLLPWFSPWPRSQETEVAAFKRLSKVLLGPVARLGHPPQMPGRVGHEFAFQH